jgi:D-arabinose 1-dehydrogenase-like Zn-dependent alcohol dehydrogenase
VKILSDNEIVLQSRGDDKTVLRLISTVPLTLDNGSITATFNLSPNTGKYTERGIKGADGFQAEYVVDHEQYFIKVPESCKDIGVLTEPMSVAAKAIDEALIIQQARQQEVAVTPNWLKGKKALVAGLGPIGLMTVFALRLHGAIVTGLDIVDEMTGFHIMIMIMLYILIKRTK